MHTTARTPGRPRALGIVAIAVALAAACAGTLAAGASGTSWLARGHLDDRTAGVPLLACPTSTGCVALSHDAGLVGHAWHSSDAGASWQHGTLPAGARDFDRLACTTATHCVAVSAYLAGSASRLRTYVTDDAGANWSASLVAAVEAFSPGLACAGALCLLTYDDGSDGGALRASADAGAHFGAVTHPFGGNGVGGAVQPACTSASACVAVGGSTAGDAWIVTTSDAGAHWGGASFPSGLHTVSAVSCGSALSCVAVASLGQADPSGHFVAAHFLRSGDAGATWTDTAVSTKFDNIFDPTLSCTSASSCLYTATLQLAPFAVIARSTDAGTSWQALGHPSDTWFVGAEACPSPGSCLLAAKSFARASQLLSVQGTSVTASRTLDEGALFSQQVCSTAAHCVVVGAIPSAHGEVAGALVTSNAGITWTPVALLGSASALSSVSCATATRCVAVGLRSVRLSYVADVLQYSTNGGVTWHAATGIGRAGLLQSVSCGDALHCAAVGPDGPAGSASDYSTTGGATWRRSAKSPRQGQLSVSCVHASCVSVGADNAAHTASAWRSADAGRTWTELSVPGVSVGLASVSCPSASVCVAVGTRSFKLAAIRVTRDAGRTWSVVAPPSGVPPLQSVSCSTPSLCVAGGTWSSTPYYDPSSTKLLAGLVRTTDGGAHWQRLALPPGTASVQRVTCGRSGCWAAVGLKDGSTSLFALR